MIKRIGFTIALFTLLISMSCQEVSRGPVEKGNLENGVYSSSYFNLRMTVPENWTVNNLGKVEKKAPATEATNSDTTLVANLLTIYQEVEQEEFKPNLSIIAESFTLYPELKNEVDYLGQIKNQYANLNPITSEIEKTILTNDIECFTFDLTMTIQEMSIQQTHFALKKNGYFIDLVITYQTDSQKEELMKITNSLSFN